MPVKPRRGDTQDLQRAAQLGRRVADWRIKKGWKQSDVARELGIDTRTYKDFEAGKSGKLKFGPDGVGQDSVSRLEAGNLGWSGSGATARWVGPGIDLLSALERIFGEPAGASIDGIYLPARGDSLEDRIRNEPGLSPHKRRHMLAILLAPDD